MKYFFLVRVDEPYQIPVTVNCYFHGNEPYTEVESSIQRIIKNVTAATIMPQALREAIARGRGVAQEEGVMVTINKCKVL